MKHAPLLALGWSALLLAFTHAGPPDELLFSLHGVLVGWGYLRYYQPTEHGMGDSREAFEFAALFPPSLRPPIQVVGGACFGVVSNCCCGLFPPASALTHEALGKGARDGAHAGAHSTLPSTFHAALHSTMPPTGVAARAEAPLPSVTTEDPELAERRRQRARQLLDERLAAKGNAATPARDMPSAPTQV
uniref:Mannosyltransferase n=2 Tax=Chrysotila carterae TaxID=13221 RepID=A0A7S4AXP8_CHRCT